MILKQLELNGFKSFVDTTRMDFTNGFTVVVGPNGCGKSNLSDAIRWVIGEQSAKMLRGVKITDLIFNGSSDRKPVGRAEISLTLGNVPPGLRIDVMARSRRPRRRSEAYELGSIRSRVGVIRSMRNEASR